VSGSRASYEDGTDEEVIAAVVESKVGVVVLGALESGLGEVESRCAPFSCVGAANGIGMEFVGSIDRRLAVRGVVFEDDFAGARVQKVQLDIQGAASLPGNASSALK
jgi:hypothetical protein